MSLRGTILITVLSLHWFSLKAQQFGGNPPSLHWEQINNDTVRVIFPRALRTQAAEVASIAGRLGKTTLPTIGNRRQKVNIVFQNQTTISNGYVQLAPFRSEFELTPDQNSFDLGSLPWPKQLVIHEYRHVQQYNNFRVGLSKAFYYLFGEGGQELANSLAIPNWFWEGDAVYQETLVSKQGRGRLPFFFSGYRSLWAAGKDYSWMKLRNGSLRDYVPDHYPLGYMLVAYGREKFGDDFWKKTTEDAASFRGLFYPLQKGLKKYSGQSFPDFRAAGLNYFRSQLKPGDQDSAGNYARSHKHFVADEEFPQFTDADHIIYVHSSYKQPPAFVIRDCRNGQEKIISRRSVSLNNYFSYRNGKAVYAAYEPDLRWGWRDFGVIRILDLQTSKEKKITTKSKYFSPDISADGQHIVAVCQGTDGSSALHVLNSQSGAIEKIIQSREPLIYTYPKFYNEEQVVAAVRNRQGEMAIGLFNIRDSGVAYLTPFSLNVIGFPAVRNDTVYFGASHEGRDRLFAVTGNRLFELTLPGIAGNYQLQSTNSRYAYTSFTAVGYKINVMERQKAEWQPLPSGELESPLFVQQIHSLENGPGNLLDGVVPAGYAAKPYPPSFRLFNFHSWRPYISDPDYSFSLVSDNVLNTMETELFVGYNRNEQYKQVGLSAIYGGFFPWISTGLTYTFDRNAIYRQEKKVFWNQVEARLGLDVPLNFSKGKTYTTLQFGSDIIYNQRYYQSVYKDSFDNRGFAYVNPYVQFVHQSQKAKQQIYPALAQSLLISYDRAVTTYQARQFLGSGYFYFPGLSATHSLVLSAAFQQRDSLNTVRFSNSFPFSRGYSGENFYRMYRLGANYHIPLAYPDWGFWNMVYFLRIRANLFYDYTKVLDFFSNGSKFQPQFRSYGTEIYFDTKWWNQLPLSFGIRYSRLIDPDFEGRGPNQWEFILPLNLLSR